MKCLKVNLRDRKFVKMFCDNLTGVMIPIDQPMSNIIKAKKVKRSFFVLNSTLIKQMTILNEFVIKCNLNVYNSNFSTHFMSNGTQTSKNYL